MTSALIERLEKAEAGSRALDYAMKEWLEFDDYWRLRVAADWTTSLDAALALAERVLPGWLWSVTTVTTSIGGVRKPSAVVMRPDHPAGEEIHSVADAATPALALCIAVLKATTANAVGMSEANAPILSPETNEQTPVTQKGGA